MVSIHYSKSAVNADGTLSNDVYIKGACLSTDSKPTENIAVGSELDIVDTGDKMYFDGTQWN